MKILILAISLAATPAGAQIVIQPPYVQDQDDDYRAEQHEQRQEQRRDDQQRHEDRRDRDHSDDEPDVMLMRYSWPHNCCHYGR